LAAFCRQHNLLLVEDCALALLSKLGTRPLGSFGDAAVFCLYKTLPVPNGGAVILRNGSPDLSRCPKTPSLTSTFLYTIRGLVRRSQCGRGQSERAAWGSTLRNKLKPVIEKWGLVKIDTLRFEPEHAELGMSFISRNVIAAQDLAAIVQRRRRNYLQLYARLHPHANVVFPCLPEGVCPLFFPLQTPNKLRMQQLLAERGIEAVNLWFYHAPGVSQGEYPDTDELRRTVLEIPCHQDLTPEVIDWIADEVCALTA
jgi:dTDP-4-amino-4,6-dideoxygalactose transaminase